MWKEADLCRPIIWIDDQLEDAYAMKMPFDSLKSVFSQKENTLCGAKGQMKNKLLPVVPDVEVGLTKEHLGHIAEFLESLS